MHTHTGNEPAGNVGAVRCDGDNLQTPEIGISCVMSGGPTGPRVYRLAVSINQAACCPSPSKREPEPLSTLNLDLI